MNTQTSTAQRALPTCRCGHTREHHLVHARPHYGFWAWFMLLNGANGTPKKITYECSRCRQVVEVTRDPEVLRNFR